LKKLWQWLATAMLVAIFLSLANWQWNRADDLKNPAEIDQTILPIDSLITPSQSITDKEVGRRVSIEGHFVSNWILPNQKGRKNYDVGLFQSKDNAMILVLRGIHQNVAPLLSSVTVVGSLVPQQNTDVAENTGNQISRIDSALFVSRTQLPLYQPYIQAISETPSSGYETIPLDLKSKVPGYYWQHISYVVIWFLFALTAIYLMVYQRKLDKVQP
jgi:cytochrome oxidase assembly protein ShyY1